MRPNKLMPSLEQFGKIKRRQLRSQNNLVSSMSFEEPPQDEVFEKLPIPQNGNTHLKETLKKHFIFAALSGEQFDEVLSKMVFVKVREGNFLFRQSSIAKYFFVIEKGEVDILIDNIKIKELGPKSFIGDLALLYNTTRTASVKASTDCFFWALEGATYKERLVALKKAQYEVSSRFVNKLEVFSKLTPEQRGRLASEMLLESYPTGASIVSQGDDATAMFIIKSGKVEIIRDDKFVTFLEAESYFGENAFAENVTKRSATVKAVGEVECFSISRGVLKDLFGHDVNMVVSMNEQRKLFNSSNVLQEFSEEQTERLLKELKIVHLQQGEVLFKKGELLSTIALVMEGELNTREKVIGDRFLLYEKFPLPFDYIALSPCKVCLLDTKKVHEIFGENLRALLDKNRKFKETMTRCTPARQAGPIVFDKLRVIKPLGEGNFGNVYLVYLNSEQHALKVVPRDRITNLADAKSLISEKAILELIKFSKIMTLHSFLKNKDAACFLNEFIDGVGFEKVLIELDIISQKDAIFYSSQILLIMQYLHLHGIIYRDLKPANLICQKNGYLKLVDLGTAKFLSKNKFGVYERTFTVIGTAHYMAPEIISASGYTFSADYWALGVMIYEMMCGCLPFGNDCEDPLQIYQQIMKEELSFPEWFDDEPSKNFIRQLLAKSPEIRTGSSLWALNTHSWFKDVDWHKILFETEESPYCPPGISISSMNSLSGTEDGYGSISEMISKRCSISEFCGKAELGKFAGLWDDF